MEFAFNTLLSGFWRVSISPPVTISLWWSITLRQSSTIEFCLNVGSFDGKLLAPSRSSGFLTCQVPMGMESMWLLPHHGNQCMLICVCQFPGWRLYRVTCAIATRENRSWLWHFKCSGKEGSNPRPIFFLSCSFLVRNYLTPEVGGLRATGWEGGFWGCERHWLLMWTNWSCQLNQKEIKSMTSGGRREPLSLKNSLQFRPGKWITSSSLYVKYQGTGKNQSSLAFKYLCVRVCMDRGWVGG